MQLLPSGIVKHKQIQADIGIQNNALESYGISFGYHA